MDSLKNRPLVEHVADGLVGIAPTCYFRTGSGATALMHSRGLREIYHFYDVAVIDHSTSEEAPPTVLSSRLLAAGERRGACSDVFGV